MSRSMNVPNNRVPCRECQQLVPYFLSEHLQDAHGTNVDDYLAKYPGAPTVSVDLYEKLRQRIDPARPRPGLLSREVQIAGVSHQVHFGVPDHACLPMPRRYRLPEGGLGGTSLFHLSLALSYAKAIWIHGPTGSGKDAVVHFFSSVTQRPTLLVQILPKVDLRPWIMTRGYRGGELTWEDGPLVRAVRDGYGEAKIPYLVLLTDIDRAEADQLEHLRIMLDSIQGRIVAPTGTHAVLKGTQFVATANTTGSGEGAMEHVTARAQDISTLNRFDVKIEWYYPSVEEAVATLKEAYPDLDPAFFVLKQKVLKSLRDASASLGAVYSMRDAFAVCDHARKLQQVAKWEGTQLMLGALRVWLGGLTSDQRVSARSVLNPQIPGGIPKEENMP